MSVTGQRPDGELFAVVVEVAVAVATGAMALAAAMVRLHDVSSLFRVPTLE